MLFFVLCSSNHWKRIGTSTTTWAELKLELFQSSLTVVASYNSSLSPPSQKLAFTPYSDSRPSRRNLA